MKSFISDANTQKLTETKQLNNSELLWKCCRNVSGSWAHLFIWMLKQTLKVSTNFSQSEA